MPVTRTIERNSLTFPDSSSKTYTFSSHLSTQDEEPNGNNLRSTQRRVSDSTKKTIGSAKHIPSALSQTSSRRSSTNDGVKQQSTMNGLTNEKNFNQQRQSPPPTKSKCTLPTTVSQPGYVTPSKLFNIMGYGLQNQYLFMHAHYLYIIDCRSREKFNESHIITGKYFIGCQMYFFFLQTEQNSMRHRHRIVKPNECYISKTRKEIFYVINFIRRKKNS
jgi:hypothetical protein